MPPQSRAAVAAVAAAAVALAALAPGCRAAPAAAPAGADAWRALDLPPSLARLLDEGTWDATPASFRIVTLSLLADSCAAAAAAGDASVLPAARACVERARALAVRTRADAAHPGDAADGMWWSHFNLILGDADAVGACADPALHAAVSAALARRALAEPTHHVPSYADLAYRWPADMTATLASLVRHDRAHGATLAAEPAHAWRTWLLAHAMDETLGLPWSEATGTAPGARDPRGCALSFETRYLAEVDPALAADWWDRYKENYLVDRVALVGFREWPPGRDRDADGDSGPIVEGVGAAATAFAIGAARTMGDGFLATRLEATGALVGLAARRDPAMAKAAGTALAEAVLLAGKSAHALAP
jgi:hypothetical protein